MLILPRSFIGRFNVNKILQLTTVIYVRVYKGKVVPELN
jgi:hypothetical protein